MTGNESRALAAVAAIVPGARRKIIQAELNGQDPAELFPFVRNIDDATLMKLRNSNSLVEFYANA